MVKLLNLGIQIHLKKKHIKLKVGGQGHYMPKQSIKTLGISGRLGGRVGSVVHGKLLGSRRASLLPAIIVLLMTLILMVLLMLLRMMTSLAETAETILMTMTEKSFMMCCC